MKKQVRLHHAEVIPQNHILDTFNNEVEKLDNTCKSSSMEVVHSGETRRKEWTAVLKLNGCHFDRLILDSGSQANVLPLGVFDALNDQG